jgi:hypothetical protein
MRYLRLLAFGLVCVGSLPAWDHPGHSIVNRLALASLPADFPAFVREPANVGRLAFLSAEPDRWSHASELPARHANWPDHFFDVERIPAAGMDLATLPSLRYDFVVQYAKGRDTHPDRFIPIDPAKNADHTREWCGFLPWTVAEYYGVLKATFAALKAYEENGTPEEVAHSQKVAVEIMGLMGHFVGDSAQPLHSTEHHNGWVGDNPNGYTTVPGIHSFIDSGLINKVRLTYDDVAGRAEPAQVLPVAARPDRRDPVFVLALDFILAQHQFVEPIYRMEKDGRLGRAPEQAVSPEGRALIEDQLLKGGRMLGDLWLTAWRTAAPDSYLRGVLLRRQGIQPPERK